MSQNFVRIAVSYAINSPYASEKYNESLRTLARNTQRSLTALGAEVQIIDAVSRSVSPQDVIAEHDGLLVLGGADLDPSLYGQEPVDESLYGVNSDADAYEIALITEAQRLSHPVLGICRGLQLLNVAAGGTLIQDLPGPNQHRRPESPSSDTFADHDVALVPETLLAAAYANRKRLPIRSSHHQAVDAVGAGLMVNAYSDDQVIEGLERAKPWTLGVQWHPEETAADRDQFNRLLRTFLQACGHR